jgi:3-isopropylmalate dehydrogenase
VTDRIVLLPGDGVGPEVVAEARRVLEAVATRSGVVLEFVEAAIGGNAIDRDGVPLPPATLAECERATALFLGAVGGPRWSDPTAPVRPEDGLLALRKHFELYANLRPIPVYASLVDLAPVRAELLDGVDILFVRELTGDVYFGPRQEQGSGSTAHDTMVYTVPEVERIARVAFDAARRRRRRLTSVDKANVLASMRLWRRTVDRVAREYPDVRVEHALVDSCAMHLVRRPASFDVVVAGNMFGDILSDEASVLSGSLGMLPSASIGAGTGDGRRFGLYEPVHGSAPDIAGRGIANPIGAILSAAMLLRFSLGRDAEAAAVERAVEAALEGGARTADLVPAGTPALSTRAMGDAILARLDEELASSEAARATS